MLWCLSDSNTKTYPAPNGDYTVQVQGIPFERGCLGESLEEKQVSYDLKMYFFIL